METGLQNLYRDGLRLAGFAPYPLRADDKPRAVWPAGIKPPPLCLDGDEDQPGESDSDLALTHSEAARLATLTLQVDGAEIDTLCGRLDPEDPVEVYGVKVGGQWLRVDVMAPYVVRALNEDLKRQIAQLQREYA